MAQMTKATVICEFCKTRNPLSRTVQVGEEFTIICTGCEMKLSVTVTAYHQTLDPWWERMTESKA